MKRLFVALAVVAVLAIGTAGAAFGQTPTPPGNQWQQGWGCGGWGYGGANGDYDLSTNPTVQRLAKDLGIGAGDLANELKAGKSVAEVAKAKNVNLDTLVNTLLAPQKDMLALRIQYGYLTQEQADSMLNFMADRARYQLEQNGFAGGFGMMGPGMIGGGMMGGGGMGPGMMGGNGGMMGRGFGPGGSGPGGQGFGPMFRGSSY